MDDHAAAVRRRSRIERVLGLITTVEPHEVGSALLLTVNIFLILASYYVIKPVRDGLILALENGAEYKAYFGGVIALALLVAVPIYARFASRVRRNRLVVGVMLFFASNLVLFYLLRHLPGLERRLGLVFYAWVGVFNMMVVAQFWAFANDIYNEEQGKRLFPLVGIGASTGAAVGSAIPGFLARTLGVYPLLLVSAAMLAVCAGLTQVVHRRESRCTVEPGARNAPRKRPGSFRMVARHRYLTYLALFALLFTCLNSNSEFILDTILSRSAAEAVAQGTLPAGDVRAWTVEWKGQFFLGVNGLGLLLQGLAVSRMVRIGGVRLALLVYPLVALLDAAALALAPLLIVVQLGKTVENAADYSINNTARHMLWLPTTRAMKYQAKQAIDTFFVRLGDVASAGLVFLLLRVGDIIDVRFYAVVNVVLAAAAVAIAHRIFDAQKELRQRRGLED